MELTPKELHKLNRAAGIIAGIADCLKSTNEAASLSLRVVADEISDLLNEKADVFDKEIASLKLDKEDE